MREARVGGRRSARVPCVSRKMRAVKSTSPGAPRSPGKIEVFAGDNLPILAGFPDASFDLIYIDPPFNTGRAQARTRIRTERAEDGDRVGFQGRRYRTTVMGASSFRDRFDDYLEFLAPRLEEAHRLLKPEGSFFLHLDYREVHYAKVLLDEIDRGPYMAPSLVGKEKAARGKTPTDTWWHTIVSPNGREKTGYPTQKPLGVLSRIVRVHSRPGDRLLDFFAGSGSFGEAGARHGRDVVLIDESPEAIEVMRRRFAGREVIFREPTPAVRIEPERAMPASPEDASAEGPKAAKVRAARAKVTKGGKKAAKAKTARAEAPKPEAMIDETNGTRRARDARGETRRGEASRKRASAASALSGKTGKLEKPSRRQGPTSEHP